MMWRSKRPFRVLLAILLLGALMGFRPISVHRVGPLSDVAIEGYDPVAYFTEGRPVKGRALLQVSWQGARWYFASPGHKRMFEEDPLKYAPAYGGYCAYCTAESGQAETPGDPEIFLVHEGRLFLLQSEAVRREWLDNLDVYASKAAAVYDRLVARSEADAEAGG
jgi:YHS domain-containing protein